MSQVTTITTTQLEKIEFLNTLPAENSQHFYEKCKEALKKSIPVIFHDARTVHLASENITLLKALTDLVHRYTESYYKGSCKTFGQSLFSEGEIAAKLWKTIEKAYDQKAFIAAEDAQSQNCA